MLKRIFTKRFGIVILTAIIVFLCVFVPIAALRTAKASGEQKEGMRHIIVWQIDGFEGGKGSRKQYLQSAADRAFKNNSTYFTVISLTADAARKNMQTGELPDLISYNAGFFGVEEYINATDFTYKCWARGAYCILGLDGADFSDINNENTVINAGKDNLTAVAAAFSGLSAAATEEPTNAYVQLINCKYKYLFGTQRDVFRLKARGVQFSVKPVNQFNDLYADVSILTRDQKKYATCLEFVEYLISDKCDATTLGLFDGFHSSDDVALSTLNNLSFDYKIDGPCGESYINEVKTVASAGDLNKIKNLLK